MFNKEMLKLQKIVALTKHCQNNNCCYNNLCEYNKSVFAVYTIQTATSAASAWEWPLFDGSGGITLSSLAFFLGSSSCNNWHFGSFGATLISLCIWLRLSEGPLKVKWHGSSSPPLVRSREYILSHYLTKNCASLANKQLTNCRHCPWNVANNYPRLVYHTNCIRVMCICTFSSTT